MWGPIIWTQVLAINITLWAVWMLLKDANELLAKILEAL